MPWYANPLFAQATDIDKSSFSWSVHALALLATLAVSFILGSYLGKKLRMRDHGWKIGLSLFTLFESIVILLMAPPLKLGIDLSSGVILVYEVDKTKLTAGQSIKREDMDRLIAAVKRRVNPGGQKEVDVRIYGTDQIRIIIPALQKEEADRVKRTISRAGNLQFRILANPRTSKEWIEQAKADPSKKQIFNADNELQAWWVPVRAKQEGDFNNSPEIAKRTRRVGDREVTEILVENDDYDATGQFLTRSGIGTDDKGQQCVTFEFNSEGARRFGKMTTTHQPDETTSPPFTYKLGIILDDELYSAPHIQGPISDRGQITGVPAEEVPELVNVLNAGSLPLALAKEPVSELFSGPTLGSDTIAKGKLAMIISCILVPAFMLVYYRFSGIVADIALVLNMLMLFAIMLSIKAAFTLTGFAGLALTVGMAVDNNVLVYERLREELERGATLRMAIRNAFHRASAVIIDANLTTLLAAVVMWILGSDQVKGFAVTLGLGVAISMYTSVFVARVIFDIAEKRQWVTQAKMLRLIGHTSIDFMHWFRYTLTASIVITVMAVVVSFYRGQGLFDIDFTGGVSVQVLFDKPQETDYVRKQLGESLRDLAVYDVKTSGQEAGLQFIINTSQSDANGQTAMTVVQNVLTKKFGDKLAHNGVVFTEPKSIASASKEAPPAEPAKKDQSRNDLPSNRMLALTEGNDGGRLSQAVVAMAAEDAAPAKSVADKAAADKEVAENEKSAADKKAVENEKTASDPYAGGLETQLKFTKAVNHEAVEQLLITAMEKEGISSEATSFHLSNPDPDYVEGDRTAYSQWVLKIKLTAEKTKSLLATLEQQVRDTPIFPASSAIGAAVAGDTQRQAILALMASWLCMIVYLWIRFQGVAFGLAAVVALVHDVFVMLGAIAVSFYLAPYLGFLMIEPFKINLTIVAAFLTIIGFSVNDTIVIFDRIREVRGKDPHLTPKMVNDSVNQTLSRTFLTSFTVLLVVAMLYLFGGEALHGFAFAMIVGVATGTYSSVYIAAPILLWLVNRSKEKKFA